MKLETKLITGRTAYQGSYLENKTNPKYFEECACCEMNPEDLNKLGVSVGENLNVKTAFGEVVVKARENDGNPEGIIFIPMGPWSNAIVNPDTGGCGTPGFKGIPAEVEKTDKEPLDMISFMRTYYYQ
ncbi:molybdopterin dinucleotide binding domain-containing protein [Methanosalsum natronophilum]|uniref:tRNA CCA-pyrophosphorylase n=1 Tax=Methanosalsum natronophilum TaxID=768733 RepID=A0A424Z3E3_9EURY|nr:molybdopterin dinucleotide binding domain-containing protein [Methanosalsum natronophilum]MCS3924207.1 formylmethanofuran dehydrogenase subunit D [Methanosalsum natronophilum]RQD89211.1 MAG: tRNA CCA-pyrophosphorylase [Methanosalsum natronophilum]